MLRLVNLLLWLQGMMASPNEAIELAAHYEKAPELIPELRMIAKRESSMQFVSVHDGDSWASRRAWNKAMKKGWLSPLCPFHERSIGGWATRGSFGLFAAYHLRYLGSYCLPPHLLDSPFVSAVIAIRKMKHICKKYGACTPYERRLVWAGLSVYMQWRASA